MLVHVPRRQLLTIETTQEPTHLRRRHRLDLAIAERRDDPARRRPVAPFVRDPPVHAIDTRSRGPSRASPPAPPRATRATPDQVREPWSSASPPHAWRAAPPPLPARAPPLRPPRPRSRPARRANRRDTARVACATRRRHPAPAMPDQACGSSDATGPNQPDSATERPGRRGRQPLLRPDEQAALLHLGTGRRGPEKIPPPKTTRSLYNNCSAAQTVQ